MNKKDLDISEKLWSNYEIEFKKWLDHMIETYEQKLLNLKKIKKIVDKSGF